MSNSSSEYNGAGVSPETFQCLIRERKAEAKLKAEEKRLHDLKRIREMKSQEGRTPLEIFPTELWQLLIDELDPRDRYHMWQIHEQFRGLMGKTHIRDNLFPQILKVAEVEEVWRGLAYDMEDDAWDKAPLAHYLTLRQVCKRLRVAIDRFLEEALLKALQEGGVGTKLKKTVDFDFTYRRLYRKILFGDMAKLNKIIASISFQPEPNSFPQHFITRSISIRLDTQFVTDTDSGNFRERFEELKRKITDVLKHFGAHIWHFSLETFQHSDPGENDLTKVYLALREWLALLPNLKWLQLQLSCDINLCTKCVDLQVLKDQPPPNIASLERVDFGVVKLSKCQRGKEELFKSILEANPQITNLQLSGCHDLLTSARSLSLRLETVGLSHSDEDGRAHFYFRRLRNLMMNTDWALKSLNVKVELERNSLLTFFQFLENFPTLENLSLEITNFVVGGESIDFLRLPNLRVLKVSMVPVIDYNNAVSGSIPFFFSLQFLLYSGKLRELDWSNKSIRIAKELKDYMDQNKQPRSSMIEFTNGWGKANESNMWQVFPALEHLTIAVTDDDFEGNEVLNCRRYHNREMVYKEIQLE